MSSKIAGLLFEIADKARLTADNIDPMAAQYVRSYAMQVDLMAHKADISERIMESAEYDRSEAIIRFKAEMEDIEKELLGMSSALANDLSGAYVSDAFQCLDDLNLCRDRAREWHDQLLCYVTYVACLGHGFKIG